MPDLGKKHECSECGAKFYDLGKADPVCPRCGAAVSGDEEPKVKPKRKRKVPAAAKVPAPAKDDAFDDEADGGDDLAGDDLDDDDLEDDDEEEDDDED